MQAVQPQLPVSFVWLLCVSWAVAWTVLHILCQWAPLPAVLLCATPRISLGSMRLPSSWQARARWRCLARQQVYNVMAVIMGSALLSEYRSKEMLFQYFTWKHQVAFTAGVGHWIVAFAEESSDWTPVGLLHLLHHALAAGMFSFCLGTGHLSLVGVSGLIFELPVVLLNIRHGLYIRQLMGAISTSKLRGLWALTLGTVIVARGGPLVFYAVSRDMWPLLWESIREPELSIWYSGVTIFAMFSCGWFAMLLAYRQEDLRAHQAYSTLLLREHSAGVHSQAANTPICEESLDKCSQDSLPSDVIAQGASCADEELALRTV